MRTCKFLCLYATFLVFALSFFCALAPAIDFPSMPSVSSPSMLEIGGTPYMPRRNTSSGNSTGTQDNSQSPQDVKSSAAGLALSAESISSLGGLEALASLTGNSNLSSYASAVSGISSLNGNESLSEALQAITQKSTSEESSASTLKETSNTLSQILEQLQVIAEKTEALPAPERVYTEDTSATSDSSSKILRFQVNGSDILGSCRTVYFSKPEDSGLFLLTGDRVFYIDSKKHIETFYFLFKPQVSKDGFFFYNVESELSQDAITSGSKLFKLSNNPEITARRTGNLVSLRYSEADWKLDMLIDLQESKE